MTKGVVKTQTRGFTLVELLVVISIIALLISILLPSLQQARAQAKAVQCATNERQVGQAVAMYLVDSEAVYPPSYVYPKNDNGEWLPTPGGQNINKDYGYMHWSWFLYNGGKVGDKSFQCPSFFNGGAPRTNPGADDEDWEDDQRDDFGRNGPDQGAVRDKQASRMAYMANAALMPRNKFNSEMPYPVSLERFDQFVQENRVRRASKTILATEFHNNWLAVSLKENQNSTVLCKSHRPISVFYASADAGYNVNGMGVYTSLVYGNGNNNSNPQTYDDFGILPYSVIKNKSNLLSTESGDAPINAVGRHHPGGDKVYGGTANFLFADGHCERITAYETMKKQLWGDRFYSLTGANEVTNYGYPDR